MTERTLQSAEKLKDEASNEKQTNEKSEEFVSECPECGGKVVQDESHAESVCEDCGLVVKEQGIDRGPDWRSFDDSKKAEKSRVGSPVTKMMHDEGMSTRIGWQNRDANGRSLSARKLRQVNRLRTWNQRSATRDSKERNLKQALGEIDRMASALGLPKPVRETASVIYRRALDEDLLRGRSIEGISTGALYAAARECDVPRSFDKFSQVSRVGKLKIKRSYRYINQELGLEIEPTTPMTYLPQFASNLELPNHIEQKAREVLKETRTSNCRVGKNPIGIAAASIYAANLLCDGGYTQSEINATTDISVVTIRNRYQELLTAYEAPFTTAEEAEEFYENQSN